MIKGTKDNKLNSSYNNRDNEAYKKDLGLSILELLRIIPDGVLVFFPSYALLNSFINAWKSI